MKTFLEIEIDLRIAENITNVKSIRKRRSKKERVFITDPKMAKD